MKLDGTPAQYKVSATEFIENVRISGRINPVLSLTWESLKITNHLSGMQIPIKTEIPIPFITAFHLRTLLLNPFECYPLWVRHGERLRIEVAKPQDPEPQPEPPNNA